MIHIFFERTGGFMGRKISFSLNLDELPPDQAAAFKKLIDESDFFSLGEPPKTAPKPDEFSYTITIDTIKFTQTIHASDASIPQVLRPLINELVTYSRNIGRNV